MQQPVPQSQPQPFGRYELIERLASGGMGEIFLARMRGAANFEKRCVIKKILPHLAGEEAFVTKFIDEANLVVQLTHGNIVPVFDMGQHAGEFYIAMEYIAGVDLRSLLKRLKAEDVQLPVAHALYIIAEVLKGLSYAHRKVDDAGESLDIIHRDVSPSNILISTNGEVKLVDFGIAKATSRSAESVTGRLQGKFGYMSPEQARGAELDARSDLFSTGVVLYELLTGVRPFDGAHDLESLERVRTHEPQPPSALRAEIPEAVDALVAAALEKSPDARPATADALLSRVMGALMTMGEAVTPSSFVDALNAQVEKPFSSEGVVLRVEDALDREIDLMLAAQGLAEETRTSTASMPSATPLVAVVEEPAQPDTDTPQEVEAQAPSPEASVEPESVEPSSEPVLEAELVSSVEEPADRGAASWVALLALLVAVALIGGWLWWQQRPGTLSVQSDVPNARITIDGEPVAARDAVRVEPGEVVRVRVEREGYETFEQDVVLEAGQAKEIFASLDAIEAPAVVAEEPEEEPAPLELERPVLFVVRPLGAATLTLSGEAQALNVPVKISTQSQHVVQVEAEGFQTCAFVLDATPLHNTQPEEPSVEAVSGCAGIEVTGELTRGATLAVQIRLEPAVVEPLEGEETTTADVVDPPETSERPKSSRNERVRVVVTSSARGACARVEGDSCASLPRELELRRRDKPVRVTVKLDGHLDETFTLDPERLKDKVTERVVDFASYVPLKIGVRWADGETMAVGDRITVNGQRVASSSGNSAQIRVAPARTYTIKAFNSAYDAEGEEVIEVSSEDKSPKAFVKFNRQAPPPQQP